MKRTLMGAALALAFALTATPAIAADTGGHDGVADLEERVAELEATTARKGNRKVSLTIYGEINKSVLWINDGSSTHHEVVENQTSPTRFGFLGQAKLDKNLSAGYRLEIQVNPEPSIPLVQDQLSVRHSAWWIEGLAGKISMGYTSMATDGIAAMTVANTDVAARMLSLQPLSGAFLLGLDLPFNELRRNLVRYDTPVMGGVMMSASLVNGDTPLGFGSNPNEAWDVAVRYAGEFAGFRAMAGIGYSQQDGNIGLLLGLGGRERVISGSASLMHIASGLFVNLGYGDVTGEQLPGPDRDYRVGHLQAGWQKNVFGIGATTLFAEYAQMDITGVDATPRMLGAGVVQAIDGLAMDLYLTGRRYELDNGGDDILAVTGGARIRF